MTDTPALRQEPRRPGSARFLFGATMQILELHIVVLGAMAMYGFRLLPVSTLWIGAVTLSVLLIVSTVLMRKGRIGWILGGITQVLMLATGIVLPMVAIATLVFVALWVAAYTVGGKIDVERQARHRAEMELWRSQGSRPADS